MKIITKEELDAIPKKVTKLERGGVWEENNIEVKYDHPIYDAENCNCPHLGEKYIERVFRSDGSYFDNIYANCPRVIVALNEGGYNSTGVCLDCVLEQLNLNLTK
jgi:hypothetical protein